MTPKETAVAKAWRCAWVWLLPLDMAQRTEQETRLEGPQDWIAAGGGGGRPTRSLQLCEGAGQSQGGGSGST